MGVETRPPGVEFWPEVGGRQDEVGGSTPQPPAIRTLVKCQRCSSLYKIVHRECCENRETENKMRSTVTEIVEKVECSSYKNKEWKRRPRTGSLLWSESYQVNEQRKDYKDNYYTGELQKTPIVCPLSITSCFVFWQIFGGSGLHRVIQTTDSETHGFLSWPAFLKRSHDYRLLSDPKCLQLALGPGLENRLGTVNKRGADNRWGHWRSLEVRCSTAAGNCAWDDLSDEY